MRPDPRAARLGSPQRPHDPARGDPASGQQANAEDRLDADQPGRAGRHRRRPGSGSGLRDRLVGRRTLRRRQLGSPRHQRDHPRSLLYQRAKPGSVLEGRLAALGRLFVIGEVSGRSEPTRAHPGSRPGSGEYDNSRTIGRVERRRAQHVELRLHQPTDERDASGASTTNETIRS